MPRLGAGEVSRIGPIARFEGWRASDGPGVEGHQGREGRMGAVTTHAPERRAFLRAVAVASLVLVLVLGAVPNALRPFLPGPVGEVGRSAAAATGHVDVAELAARVGGVAERLDEAALAELAAGRTDVAAPQELPAGMESLGAACVDVAILGVRGSGESATENNGLGETVNAAVAAMAHRLKGLRVGVHAVDYPAAPVSTLLGDSSVYTAGIGFGAGRLASVLEARARTCPEERRVVIGFSQGAMVVHAVLGRAGRAGEVARAATDAALLVADGYRNPADLVHAYGSAEPTVGVGRVVGMGSVLMPGDMAQRTISVCDAGDPVCNPAAVSTDGVATHTSYKVGHTAAREAAVATANLALAGR